MNSLKVKVLRDGAVVPSKDSGNSGYDLYGIFDPSSILVLYPGDSHLFDTGLAIEIPVGYGFLVGNRGSRGSKGLVYGAHVVDAIYRGEVFVDLHNISNNIMVFTDMKMDEFKQYLVNLEVSEEVEVYNSDPLQELRFMLLNSDVAMDVYGAVFDDAITLVETSKAIAQGMIVPTMDWPVEVVDELSETSRGDGKLGSSGK